MCITGIDNSFMLMISYCTLSVSCHRQKLLLCIRCKVMSLLCVSDVSSQTAINKTEPPEENEISDELKAVEVRVDWASLVSQTEHLP